MASEEEEVAGLDRVLTRLALTEEENLEKVLQKLLPAVIGMLKSPHGRTRAKILEVLSHVNKRVRARKGIHLPLPALVAMWSDPATAPMSRNFALVYAEMAFEAAPPEEQLAAVAPLLSGLSQRPAQHRGICLRLAMAGLSVAPSPNASASALAAVGLPPDATAARIAAALPAEEADRQLLLDHALKVLLYQPASSGRGVARQTPLGMANAAAVAAAGGDQAAAAVAAPPPPAGLTAADVNALEEKGAPAPDALAKQKLGLLNFLHAAATPPPAAAGPGSLPGLLGKAPAAPAAALAATAGAASASGHGGNGAVAEGSEGPTDAMEIETEAVAVVPVALTPAQLLLPLLAASCDSNEAVARRGDELLKRICNPEGAKPGVDLEEPGLVRKLYALLLGGLDEPSITSAATPAAPQPPADQQPSPASPPLAQRIMPLLVRSVTAANSFPASARAMSFCLYGSSSSGSSAGGSSTAAGAVAAAFGSGTTQRLRQLGMEFTVWVFKHAALFQLRAMAPAVMRRLMGGLGMQNAVPSGASGSGGGGGVEGGEGLEELRVGGAVQSAAALAMCGFAYQAVAQLSQRLPEYFAGNAAIARHFFAALATEPPGLRATVQEALSMLATAYATANNAPDAAASAAKAAAAPGAAGVAATGMAGSAVGEELEGLLLESVKSHQDSVRLCAVQWAARLFPATHVPSRYICVLGAGDVKQEVREAAAKGLQQHPTQRLQAQQAQQDKQAKQGKQAATTASPAAVTPSSPAAPAAPERQFPEPAAVLAYVVQKHPALAAVPDPGRSLQLPPRSFQALITFLKAARAEAAEAAGAKGGADPEVLPDAAGSSTGDKERASYVQLLEHALCREAPSELLVAALEALVDVANEGTEARQELAHRYTTRLQWLRSLLCHTDASARLASARLLGLAATALQPDAATELLQQLLATFPPATGPAAAAKGSDGGLLSSLGEQRQVTAGSGRYEDQDGALLATGFIAAQLRAAATPGTALHAAIDATASRLVVALSSKASGLAGSAALSIGHLGLTGPLPASAATSAAAAAAAAATPAAASSTSGNGTAAGSTAAATASTSGTPATAPTDTSSISKDEPVKGATAVVNALLAVARDPKGDHRAAVRAIGAIGYLAHGDASSDVLGPAVEGLLSLASLKKGEEVTIAAGEALALAFGAVPVSADTILCSNFSSLGGSLPEAVLSPAPAALPAGDAMQVDNAAGSDLSSGSAAASPAQADVRASLLERLTSEFALSPRAEVRSAAAVWLVSLLTYCGAAVELRDRERLAQLQGTFSALLGDANDLTQEMASRGVSLVYRLGGPEARKKLVEALVGVLQGTSASGGARAVKVTGDTKVFEDGAIGTAPGGGGLSTYKELCALATDLGQPDLIYKFMDLANHAAAVNSRRGAAFGVAGIARLISGSSAGGSGSSGGSSSSSDGFGALGELLGRQQLLALLPKLYRYQFDPNPRVQESMGAIWAALIDDPRKALDEHFDGVMADLLKELGGRLWRSRQASCAALADLLQGRRWTQLAPHFTQVWSMTLRVMDDVKESVRLAGIALCRSVRGLTLRLVDTDYSTAAEARAAVSATLPLLLEVGLPSNVAEVRVVALDTIAKIVKGAGAEQVRPLIPALTRAMLEALSGLEDSRLNYVEQHAERMGLDADRLEGARVAASRSSPAAETLDLAARYVDASSMDSLTPVLVDLIKRGVGLNTKAGTARFVRSLATRLASDLRPTAPVLLKALTSAVRAERSGGVRRGYAAAAAAVAKCASEKRQERLVEDALAMYGSLEAGDNDTPPSADERVGGGLLLRELLRTAPDLFNRYADKILPVAFAARLDDDSSAAAAWAAVWEEGAPSEGAAVRMHLAAVVGVVASGLGSQQWGRKKACAEALTSLSGLAGSALSTHAPRLAALLIRESTGRLWDGKESLLAALGALCSSCCAALCADPGLDVLVDALLAAAARKKGSYRAAALEALEKLLGALVPLVTPSGQQNSVSASQSAAAVSSNGSQPAAAGCSSSQATVSGPGLYERVSHPLLEACRRHATGAGTAKPATSSNGTDSAADADAAAVDKPLPLPESLRCLAAAWKLAPGPTKAATGQELAATIAAVLRAPGLPWTAWAAAAAGAQALVKDAVAAGLSSADDSAAGVSGEGGAGRVEGSGGGRLAVWLPPLLLGLGSACTNTAVGQVRTAALEGIKEVLKATNGGRQLPAEATVSAAAAAAAAAGDASKPESGADGAAPSAAGAVAGSAPTAAPLPPVPCVLPGQEGGDEALLPWLRRLLKEVGEGEKAPAVRSQALTALSAVADDMQMD